MQPIDYRNLSVSLCKDKRQIYAFTNLHELEKHKMELSTSYKSILQISLPLIIASLGHSAIGAMDTFFLGRLGDATYLAAVGLVAPLYMMITLVSLALARGGQIMIARRLGAGKFAEIGLISRNMFYFEIALAIAVFIIIQLFGYHILASFVDSSELLQLCLDYLDYRIWGVFLGCAGAAFISLYTGVARTKIIIIASAVIAITNGIFNYGLIFGELGMPQMGMSGAGLASAIAEGFGFLTFLWFAIRDKNSTKYTLFKRSNIDFDQIKQQLRLSTPIALQNFLSLLSWVVFFGLVENLGKLPIAVSSVMRVMYLFLGAIAWGVGSGTNTIVSILIGNQQHQRVMPMLHKITILTVVLSAIAGSFLLFFPNYIIQAITDESSVIQGTIPMMPMIFILLINLAIYTIYYNGIIGTGDIKRALWITTLSVASYIIYVTIVVKIMMLNLYWAWSAEIVYGIITLSLSLFYLKKAKWQKVKV